MLCCLRGASWGCEALASPPNTCVKGSENFNRLALGHSAAHRPAAQGTVCCIAAPRQARTGPSWARKPSNLTQPPLAARVAGLAARAAGAKVDVLWRCSEQVSEGNRSALTSLAGTPSSVLGNLHPGYGHPRACKGQSEGCTYLSVRARLAWSPQWSQDCSGIASGARQSAPRLAAMPPCERLQRSDQLLALHCVRPGPPLACWPLPPQSHLLSPRCRAAGGHVRPLVVRLVARVSVVSTTAAMCASVVLMVAATDGRRADLPSSRDWGCTSDCG